MGLFAAQALLEIRAALYPVIFMDNAEPCQAQGSKPGEKASVSEPAVEEPGKGGVDK